MRELWSQCLILQDNDKFYCLTNIVTIYSFTEMWQEKRIAQYCRQREIEDENNGSFSANLNKRPRKNSTESANHGDELAWHGIMRIADIAGMENFWGDFGEDSEDGENEEDEEQEEQEEQEEESEEQDEDDDGGDDDDDENEVEAANSETICEESYGIISTLKSIVVCARFERQIDCSVKLYAGSLLTKEEAAALIDSHIHMHGLNEATSKSLLSLLKVLLPAGSELPIHFPNLEE